MTTSTTSAAAADRDDAGPPGYRLPRAARIRHGRDIRHIIRQGERRAGRVVILFRAPSPAGRPRIAVVVPKHGHKAVARNRLRRRLRDVLRIDYLPGAFASDPPMDIVLMAKPAAYLVSYGRLRDSVLDTVRRACVS